MSSVIFDTLRFTRRLKDAGVPEQQAEAEAEAIRQAFSEVLDSQVATRADIHGLGADIHTLKADIHRLEAEQRLMKWMLGFNLAFTLAMFWKMFIAQA